MLTKIKISSISSCYRCSSSQSSSVRVVEMVVVAVAVATVVAEHMYTLHFANDSKNASLISNNWAKTPAVRMTKCNATMGTFFFSAQLFLPG